MTLSDFVTVLLSCVVSINIPTSERRRHQGYRRIDAGKHITPDITKWRLLPLTRAPGTALSRWQPLSSCASSGRRHA